MASSVGFEVLLHLDDATRVGHLHVRLPEEELILPADRALLEQVLLQVGHADTVNIPEDAP